VKEFRKSVNIWGSYGQEFSVLFLTHGEHYHYVDVLSQYVNSAVARSIDFVRIGLALINTLLGQLSFASLRGH